MHLNLEGFMKETGNSEFQSDSYEDSCKPKYLLLGTYTYFDLFA